MEADAIGLADASGGERGGIYGLRHGAHLPREVIRGGLAIYGKGRA